MTVAGSAVKATIKAIWPESPTVKGLRLALDTIGSLSFQPGQWVDFQVPGIKHVGGYSICSTPQELQQTGVFELCVKISGHPCAQWVHHKAAPGDKVDVQVGGTFTLAPGSRRPALFVAGGIGITCLTSMLGHLVEQETAARQASPHAGPGEQLQPPLLLYSAATPEEFALLPRLLNWQRDGLLRLQLHTSKSHGTIPAVQQEQQQTEQQAQPTNQAVTQVVVEQGRIGRPHLQQALQVSGCGPQQSVDAYVCGPPRMTDDIVDLLKQLGLSDESIRTEKWW